MLLIFSLLSFFLLTESYHFLQHPLEKRIGYIYGLKDVSKINEQMPILIPSWIKNNSGWWANGQISDSDFISGIQYMIQNNIIKIKNLPQPGESSDQVIPSWIKDNAGWWAENKISDTDPSAPTNPGDVDRKVGQIAKGRADCDSDCFA